MSDFYGRERYFQFGWRHRLEVVHDKLFRGGKPYMERWALRTFLGHLRIHKITASDDPSQPFHDHPMSFVSLILTGGYLELRPGRCAREFFSGDINFCRAEEAHCLLLRKGALPVRDDGPVETTWTLVVSGRPYRDWGFLTEDGWVGHEDYLTGR
jgi:hypothetical protein